MATTTTKKKPIKSSLSKRRIQSFARDKMAVICFFGMMIMILLCICAPLLTPYDPAKIVLADRNLPVSAEHPLGTDMMGRDVFARILYGGRYSIAIGLAGSLCTITVGAIMGCIAGFFGGIVDRIIVTVQEYLSFFPQILTIMLFVGVFGGASIPLLILIWASTGWGGTMRIVRRSYNHTLEIEGVILTMFDGRTNLSFEVAEEVKKYFKEKVYRTAIPRNVRLSESPSHGKPVIAYDPSSRGSHAYLDLAEEIMTRSERKGNR